MALIHDDDQADDAHVPIRRKIDLQPLDLRSVDPARVQVSFDRRSDTLLIHLFGRDRDSISVPIAKYLDVLVDPETEQVIGLHIEGFLAQAVKDVPASIGLLDFAELRGITPAETRLLGAQSVSGAPRLPQGCLDPRAAPRMIQERRRDAIVSFIAAERVRWHLPFFPAA